MRRHAGVFVALLFCAGVATALAPQDRGGEATPGKPGPSNLAAVSPYFVDTLVEPTTTSERPATPVPRATRQRPAPRPRASSPARAGSGAPVVHGDLLDALARCESGGNPRAVGGGGRYFGAFQFVLSTWRNLGGTGNPIDHSYAVQKSIAAKIPVSAWDTQFPTCARRLGVA